MIRLDFKCLIGGTTLILGVLTFSGCTDDEVFQNHNNVGSAQKTNMIDSRSRSDVQDDNGDSDDMIDEGRESEPNQVVSMVLAEEGTGQNKFKEAPGRGFVGCFFYSDAWINGISIIDDNTGAQLNSDITNDATGDKLMYPNKFVGISFIPVQVITYLIEVGGHYGHIYIDLVGNVDMGNGQKRLIFINSVTSKFIYGPVLATSSANKIEYDFVHDVLVADQYHPNGSQNGSAVTVDMITGSLGYANVWWNLSDIPSQGFSFSEGSYWSGANALFAFYETTTNLLGELDQVDPQWYNNNNNFGINPQTSIIPSQFAQEILDTRRSLEDDERMCDNCTDGKFYVSFGETNPLFLIGGTSYNYTMTQFVVSVQMFLEDMTYKR